MKQEKAGEAAEWEAEEGRLLLKLSTRQHLEVGVDNLAVRELTVQVYKKRTAQRACGSHLM